MGKLSLTPFAKIVHNSGIVFRHPCPHTSVQNGRVERKHCQVVEMGLSMLAKLEFLYDTRWMHFRQQQHL